MAKSNEQKSDNPAKAFIQSLKRLPPVYDAQEFTNRPFTFMSVEWQVFEPNERNNYRSNEKAKIHGYEISRQREVILETTQKGIIEVIAAMEEAGLFNVDVMIVKEGKFCTVEAI